MQLAPRDTLPKIDVGLTNTGSHMASFPRAHAFGAWSLAVKAYLIYDLAKIENKQSFLNASYTDHGTAYKALRKVKELWGEMKHADRNQNDVVSVTFDYTDALILERVRQPE